MRIPKYVWVMIGFGIGFGLLIGLRLYVEGSDSGPCHMVTIDGVRCIRCTSYRSAPSLSCDWKEEK